MKEIGWFARDRTVLANPVPLVANTPPDLVAHLEASTVHPRMADPVLLDGVIGEIVEAGSDAHYAEEFTLGQADVAKQVGDVLVLNRIVPGVFLVSDHRARVIFITDLPERGVRPEKAEIRSGIARVTKAELLGTAPVLVVASTNHEFVVGEHIGIVVDVVGDVRDVVALLFEEAKTVDRVPHMIGGRTADRPVVGDHVRGLGPIFGLLVGAGEPVEALTAPAVVRLGGRVGELDEDVRVSVLGFVHGEDVARGLAFVLTAGGHELRHVRPGGPVLAYLQGVGDRPVTLHESRLGVPVGNRSLLTSFLGQRRDSPSASTTVPSKPVDVDAVVRRGGSANVKIEALIGRDASSRGIALDVVVDIPGMRASRSRSTGSGGHPVVVARSLILLADIVRRGLI